MRKHLLLTSLFWLTVSTCYASNPTIRDVASAELKYNVSYYESNEAILNAKKRHVEAFEGHQKNLMEIVERAYNTQHWMTIGVFFIVSVLVLGGFYISFLQFKAGISPQGDKGEAPAPTTFKLGKTGVEFSSSIIGLVILCMSFMFFYLYVKDVYSIKTNYASPVELDPALKASQKTGESTL